MEKPSNMSCPVCDRTFSKLYNLQRHMQTHGEQTSHHECEECGAKLRTRFALSRHRIRFHLPIGENAPQSVTTPLIAPFLEEGEMCVECSTTHADTFELEEHMRKEHPPLAKRRKKQSGFGVTLRSGRQTDKRGSTEAVLRPSDPPSVSQVLSRDEVEPGQGTVQGSATGVESVAATSVHQLPMAVAGPSTSALAGDVDNDLSVAIDGPSTSTLSRKIDNNLPMAIDGPSTSGLVGQVTNTAQDINEQDKKKPNRAVPFLSPDGDSFVDPLQTPPDYWEHDIDEDVLRRNWGGIRTYLKRRKVQDVLNIRLWPRQQETEGEPDHAEQLIRRMWDETRCPIKLTCSPGFFLQHKTDGTQKYYHSSSNNNLVFDKPRLINSETTLQAFLADLSQVNMREVASFGRPNTSWLVRAVTNLTVYSTKLLGMGKVGCDDGGMPAYILNNRHVLTLHKRPRTGKPYTDNLCFFRCLSVILDCRCTGGRCMCTRPSELTVKRLFARYCADRGVDPHMSFGGISDSELLTLEKLFDVAIIVLCLSVTGESSVLWSSGTVHQRSLYLNAFGRHYSLIKDINGFAKSYSCMDCAGSYTRFYSLRRHVCNPQDTGALKFFGGVFTTPSTIVSDIKDQTGIELVAANQLFYPYRITYDIECMLTRETLPDSTPSTKFTSLHEFLSVSVCSNIPGYTEPVCFVREDPSSPQECIDRFVTYLWGASKHARELLLDVFGDVIAAVDRKVKEQRDLEEPYKDAGFSNPHAYANRAGLCQLLDRIDKHISSIPVVGYNSGRYDMNVIKGYLMRSICALEEEKFSFVVKRVNNMTCIQTTSFRFLDICNFIAPGFDYARYLKAYGCSADKGFFPYEWMDSLDKLAHPSLPPIEAFNSSLRGTTMSPEDYDLCRKVWSGRDMKSFRDFLVWYNNLDVEPFLEAIEQQSRIYRSKGIDMLKSAISLPGLAIRWLFTQIESPPILTFNSRCSVADVCTSVKQSLPVMLLDKPNEDLYSIIRGGIVGGPSIVFHRYHEVGLTRIREKTYGSSAKVCGKIVGVDANALYLWSMSQEMPTGYPSRQKESDGFRTSGGRWGSKVAHCWLEFVAASRGIEIQHQQRGGEKRIGQHGLFVDGFCADRHEVFQFHGCFWHGHPCSATEGVDIHPTKKTSMDDIYADTLLKDQYIRDLGYTLTVKWECEWRRETRENGTAGEFSRHFHNIVYPTIRRTRELSDIVANIVSGKFFGLVECDISVPPHLHSYFSEMAPIFKNTMVGRDHLSQHMADFATGTHHLTYPQRSLVGSLFGEKILLLSELARWYLQHGLVITRVYQLVRYVPRKIFADFAQSVTEARRAGDADPELKLLADTSKLIGNSAYGKTITDKERHRRVVYVDGPRQASQHVRGTGFISLNEISNDFYEVELAKSKVSTLYCSFFFLSVSFL